jgi:hypothetical protein
LPESVDRHSHQDAAEADTFPIPPLHLIEHFFPGCGGLLPLTSTNGPDGQPPQDAVTPKVECVLRSSIAEQFVRVRRQAGVQRED